MTIRIGLAGLGKMGLSHLAIVNAHPELEVAAVCDGLSYLTNNLKKFTPFNCYNDYQDMLANEQLDAVLIATPSKAHATMANQAIQAGLHVFCEKPFVLDINEGQKIITQAATNDLVTQVGYHNRFVGAFQKAQQLVAEGALGTVYHFRAEAYGPVVIRPQSATWRSKKSEGGGVVYDYACHALDLVNFVLGPVEDVSGVIRNNIFSKDVDDEVYCSLTLKNNLQGQLAANWSDESQRKMTTKLTIWGTTGQINVDRQECALYLRNESTASLPKGWSIYNTTELTDEVWYYLRGEEYSAQIDEFVERINTQNKKTTTACDFATALETDRACAMINGLETDPAADGKVDQVAVRQSFTQRLRGLLGAKHA
ncbi:MAG: Gfo/Idh/MocA family oxidoreductase [Pseudomonadaceae bacterium]|nr:Gfo/Idh/MocA family oxidoreductase [Pseudomonadaceae bacterium]